MRIVADERIDQFSSDILGYNRNRPRDGQPLPGDVIRKVNERMEANDRRLAMFRKRVGAVILGFITIVMGAAVTGIWPSWTAWLGAHL